MEAQLTTYTYKNLQRRISKVVVSPMHGSSSWSLRMLRLLLGLCWFFLHQMLNIVQIAVGVRDAIESFLVSSGLLENYKVVPIDKLRHLAIVVDSGEAFHTSKIIKLLDWLSAIGVKHVSLYDIEGIIKKNKETYANSLSNTILWEESGECASFHDKEIMTLEFLSYSDGKEGVAKAAGFLCSKYQKIKSLHPKNERLFTEKDMDFALKAVGCGGPSPDLLLIYGPARCHLGFPAWRMRYTELVHMGTLESMNFGSVLKALHKFTRVKQNFGK